MPPERALYAGSMVLSVRCESVSDNPEMGSLGRQFAPLGQGGSTFCHESVSSAEVAVVVEVIVDRGVDGGEFL